MTQTAGKRRAGTPQPPTASWLALTRSGSSQPRVSSTSGPRQAPSLSPPPECPGERGRSSQVGPWRGTVCVTYVTGRPATELQTTAHSPGKKRRAATGAPSRQAAESVRSRGVEGVGRAAPTLWPRPSDFTRRPRRALFGLLAGGRRKLRGDVALPRQPR